MSAAFWHKDENAVYEIDYECVKRSEKTIKTINSAAENLVLNYFVLLVSCYFV